MPSNFWALFKDKYSTPRSSTPRENQYRPRHKTIFNLQQDDREEDLREERLETFYILPTVCKSRVETRKKKARNMHKHEEQFSHMQGKGDILIIDTGGGRNITITRRVRHTFD